MCGISGIIAREATASLPQEWIERMMAVQAHRGPDDEHAVRFPGCLLGFNRLSIQDLSEHGRQPMTVPESAATIVFNGEIYNFIELAEEFRSRGIQFGSHSDTEVLLRSYLLRGEGCLSELNGMFAFLVYDSTSGEWFAARDRFGVKPFYYYHDSDYFCFASEIKALLELPFVPRRPNLKVLFGGTFGRGNDRWPETCFEEIRQLPPSRWLRGSRRRWAPDIRRYWSIPNLPPTPAARGEHESRILESEFSDAILSAISLRLRSDRPVGLLLSSGVDSSCIASGIATLAGKGGRQWVGELPTFFTMSLPGEAFDESDGALDTCRHLGIPCQVVRCDQPDLKRLIPATLWHNDEPLPYLNRCVHWQMMEAVADRGIIVVLNGQGGDETTGGYPGRLLGATLAMALRTEGLQGFLAEWRSQRALRGYSRRWMASQLIKPYVSHRNIRAFQALLTEQALRLATLSFLARGIFRDVSPRQVQGDFVNDQLLRWLTRDTVPDLCHYEDRNAAAHGLEQRFPFLDYRIAELMFRLPWREKVHRGVSRTLVRRAMRGVVPQSVLDSHRKIGLEVPEDKWVRGPLAELIQDVSASRNFQQRGLWRPGAVRRLIREHQTGRRAAGNLIWRIIGTELWLEMFIDSRPAIPRRAPRSRLAVPGRRL